MDCGNDRREWQTLEKAMEILPKVGNVNFFEFGLVRQGRVCMMSRS